MLFSRSPVTILLDIISYMRSCRDDCSMANWNNESHLDAAQPRFRVQNLEFDEGMKSINSPILNTLTFPQGDLIVPGQGMYYQKEPYTSHFSEYSACFL